MMNRKCIFLAIISVLVTFFSNRTATGQPVTTGTLLREMTDLKRLAEQPAHPYKYIQFSSYDRRSTSVNEPGWFGNSDGFGNEPVPGFEKVLKTPDENGTGEYLIAEVKGPGAILRLWTARINGKIRLFLDGSAIYEGPAHDFFWKMPEKLAPETFPADYRDAFRQFDATYFPVPFAKSCRIEWIGDLKKTHFYHVGIRVYEPPCEVETFDPARLSSYLPRIEEVTEIMRDPGKDRVDDPTAVTPFEAEISGQSKKELIRFSGSRAIEYLSLKMSGGDLNKLLRQSILNVYFDDSSVPQIQSPVGDFFGAAPGINPYQSVPFSVKPDGTMECRFLMPFRTSARIEIENLSEENVRLRGGVRVAGYDWTEGKSMHFRARWRINHELKASNVNVTDIPYLTAFGQGRVVGATSILLNPSPAPASNGNWWGEGDEKIFVDRGTFPSFFGTGSEDYYNYSWSSSAIFSLPYCGQPRNDGPGNRGFVSNYRWHILDDIPFTDRLAFYMELLHHGEVPGFAYGRMVYLYSLPGLPDDHVQVTKDDVREQTVPEWEPMAYRGSNGYRFINAEELIHFGSNIRTEEWSLGAGGKIVIWHPAFQGDKISFSLPEDMETSNSRLVITFAKLPDGGEVSVYMNGNLLKMSGEEVINLCGPHHRVLRNYNSVPFDLKKEGGNELTVEYVGKAGNKKIGIDFFWIKNKRLS